MIQKWFSSYRFSYPKTLIYMLQATEYDIPDYLHWYYQVGNFSQVEKRKKFVKTPKSLLLLCITWLMIISITITFLAFLLTNFNLTNFFLFILTIIIFPTLLAYLIIPPLLLIDVVIQKPLAVIKENQIKTKLAQHSGVKIAIAGSYGKTTMKEILQAVLSQGKIVASPKNSFNTLWGIADFVSKLKGDEDILIFELGEYFPGDINKLCKIINPDIGIITGINEAHLKKFKTLEKTAQTIFELADYLKDKTVYVNEENTLTKKRAKKNHILYSRHQIDNWRIHRAESDLSGTTFIIESSNSKMIFNSQLLGLHHVGPLALSIHLAFKVGLNHNQISKGVSQTKAFSHRLEKKIDASGVIFLDDTYNGNPDGVKAVIDFLAGIKNHRKFYITPGLVEMGDRTSTVHQEIGKKIAGAKIEKVILIKNSVTPMIAEGLKKANYQGEVIWFDDAIKAYEALPQLTVKNDVVLMQNDWPDQYQ